MFSEPSDPVTVASKAIDEANRTGRDVVIVDTAGRLAIDEELMEQVRQISGQVQPDYTFLVIDAMTGQDAVNTAKAFNETLELDGVILTKLDGDARGGALGGVAVAVGVALYALGLLFEVVGDAQLARFKADPANEGKVMRTGLWRYTRHPNYFGDACVWWGLALVAAETGSGAWGLLGALVMTILLRRVSGVTLLERSLRKRREGYEQYIARTSPFLPRPPKKI